MNQRTLSLALWFALSALSSLCAATEKAAEPILLACCLSPEQTKELKEQYSAIRTGLSSEQSNIVFIETAHLTLKWYVDSSRRRLAACETKDRAENKTCEIIRSNLGAHERELNEFLTKAKPILESKSEAVDQAMEKMREARKKFPPCGL